MKSDIVIVGCGGTGSHYIKELGRYLYGNRYLRNDEIRIVLVDGDQVEDKNLVRQAFLPQDIGYNKAQVMAEMLSQAYGLSVDYYDGYIDCEKDIEKLVRDNSLVFLVGCVDNHQCRQSMHSFYMNREHCIYMDSANEYQSGEIVIGSRIGGMEMYPDRASYFPDVLQEGAVKRSEESCEVLNQAEPQHLLTNQFAALILLANTIKFLSDDWPGGIVFFDAFKCYSMDRTPREEAS